MGLGIYENPDNIIIIDILNMSRALKIIDDIILIIEFSGSGAMKNATMSLYTEEGTVPSNKAQTVAPNSIKNTKITEYVI